MATSTIAYSPYTNFTDDVAVFWNVHGTVVGVHISTYVRDQVEGLVSSTVDLKAERSFVRSEGDSEQRVTNDSVICNLSCKEKKVGYSM